MLTYLDVMRELHESLLPAIYLEIGVHRGDSLRLAVPGTTVIGVDPEPDLDPGDPLLPRVVTTSSDEFFAGDLPGELAGHRAIDLTFIDGLHLFDFALRDFANAEALSAPESLIVIHDVLPVDAETSARERATDFWTGDVWKIVLCLLDKRPDLDLRILDVPPSGLCLVRRLSPGDSTIRTGGDDLVEAYRELQFDDWLQRRDEVAARTFDNAESRAWALRRAESEARDDAARRELEQLQLALEETRAQMTASEARGASLSSELAEATTEREALRDEVNALRDAALRLEAEVRRQSAEVARLETDLRRVAESLSWRLTAPVRSLGSALKPSSRT
jgi:hypothetical protein